jgi:hypothetical protein
MTRITRPGRNELLSASRRIAKRKKRRNAAAGRGRKNGVFGVAKVGMLEESM